MYRTNGTGLDIVGFIFRVVDSLANLKGALPVRQEAIPTVCAIARHRQVVAIVLASGSSAEAAVIIVLAVAGKCLQADFVVGSKTVCQVGRIAGIAETVIVRVVCLTFSVTDVGESVRAILRHLQAVLEILVAAAYACGKL